MNAARRKIITDLAGGVDTAPLSNLLTNVEAVLEEEQDAYDNMPEGLQQSERGQASEAALEALEEAQGNVQEALDLLEEAISALERAAE